MNVLKKKRMLAGMSLRQAASAIGTSATTISNWESGKQLPRPSKFKAMCDAYKCNAEEIINIYNGGSNAE